MEIIGIAVAVGVVVGAVWAIFEARGRSRRRQMQPARRALLDSSARPVINPMVAAQPAQDSNGLYYVQCRACRQRIVLNEFCSNCGARL